jgi:hypothetical protein
MKIEKLNAGTDLYLSCNLLDQCNGVEGFSNVKSLKMSYGSTAKEVTNNIIYIESEDVYKLQEFNKSERTPVIIEKDMFGKQKIWIKSSAFSDHVFQSLKNSQVLSTNVLEEVIESALKNYYKDNKLNISILNGLGNVQRKEAYKEIKPEEMLKNFLNIANKEPLKFYIEGENCVVMFDKTNLDNIKDKMKEKALQVIKVRGLLKTKASSLNDLIQETKIDKKIKKNKP